MKCLFKHLCVFSGLFVQTLVASEFTSNASDPFCEADKAVATSTDQQIVSKKPLPLLPEESTAEWIERNLRVVGKLKEGEHLLPHEIWRITDKLNALAAQKKLKNHNH